MTRLELARAATRLAGRAASYGTCVGLACGFLYVGLRLDKIDLAVPIVYAGDALLILPMIQAQHEGGTHWVAARMGAPGRLDLYDFPVIDHWHFAAVGLIDWVVDQPIVAANAYYLLTYPLAAFCAMLAGRCLGLSLPAAGCLGLLYAFLPYHQIRGFSHYFLSAYYLLPLAMVVALNLALGRVRLRRASWPVAVLIATSCAGAYYAFFVCVVLSVAGLYGAALRRSYRPLVWGAVFVGVVFAGGVANHAPSLLADRVGGGNSTLVDRQPEEAESYAMKLTYLVLPVTNHRVPALARVRAAHDSPTRPFKDEANTATLGFVGSAGLLLAAVTLFRPDARRRRVARAASALTLAAVFYATPGGVGALFNDFVTGSVRAQSRISVLVAFYAFWLAIAAIDRGLRWRPFARWPLFGAVATLGLLDLTPKDWGGSAVVESRAAVKAQFARDAAFYRAVEARLGGGTVFQLPFNDFPEGLCQLGTAMGNNDHARGYLLTTRTRWSFGATRGHEVDRWQREVATSEAPAMLRRLVLRDFDGLCIDWRGYPPPAAQALAKAVQDELRVAGPGLTHEGGEQAFYDLRPYRERVRAELGERYAEAARDEAEAVRVLWFKGFATREPLGLEQRWQWCARRGEAWIANPSGRTRRVRLAMVLRTESKLPTGLRIAGNVWRESLTIDADSPAHYVTVEVPPGHHRVRFECDPPPDWVPRDARRQVFYVADFQLTEGR